MGGRVRRHTEIIRTVAHELSNAPDRLDRPNSAAEAHARFEAFLEHLSATTPRAGLAAATAALVDDLVRRARRYGAHLFVCFDDPRIPATSNGIEGVFRDVKHTLRHSLGCGSTTNTVASNLGEHAIVAYQWIRQPGVLEHLRTSTASPADFRTVRMRLARDEAPGILQRSMVRHLDRHLDRLRLGWLGSAETTDADA